MIRIGMSTSCVFPSATDTAFRFAAEAGFDGIEVMITGRETRSVEYLRRLSSRYSLPILAVHAPVLVLTQFVWGLDPRVKLERSAELARDLDAPTVVVHPPFAVQRRYAAGFVDAVREISEWSGRELAVENMFPWAVAGTRFAAYAPHHDPSHLDVDAMTLDFSHAALAGQDALEIALRMGSRLRHVHLTDGSAAASSRLHDEHLVPGHGSQPVAGVLEHLSRSGWSGSVVAEVATRHAGSDAERMRLLIETVDFARAAVARGAAPVRTSARRPAAG